jgi:integrase
MPTRKRADKFPLWLHPSGQWCKKHRGRFVYFGTDKDEALKRYAAEWDDIREGRAPKPRADAFTVAEAVNTFLTEKRNRVDSGELSGGTWGEYFHACEQVIETFGRGRRVADLRPNDFGRLRAAAAKRLGPVSLSKFITLVKTLFSHVYRCELVDTPPRYGVLFDKPARRVLRLERATRGPKLIDVADVRKLIAAAGPQLRAMIYLGLNGGMGATDCANLPRSALAVRAGWCEYPRSKTGIPRRFPLWPETAAALAAVETVRPDPREPADAGCVFLTTYGRRWVRFVDRGGRGGVRLDAAVGRFRDLARKCGVKLPGGFYTLRHVFRTQADAAKDQPAADLIMGHADGSMAGHYRQAIADDRLLAVVNSVRNWLLGGVPPPTEAANAGPGR